MIVLANLPSPGRYLQGMRTRYLPHGIFATHGLIRVCRDRQGEGRESVENPLRFVEIGEFGL